MARTYTNQQTNNNNRPIHKRTQNKNKVTSLFSVCISFAYFHRGNLYILALGLGTISMPMTRVAGSAILFVANLSVSSAILGCAVERGRFRLVVFALACFCLLSRFCCLRKELPSVASTIKINFAPEYI